MADAIKFHDELNPKLWQHTHLRPEVQRQLKIIADDFLEELGIDDLAVEDITVSGSNAAYSYTPHSDLDLHIVVDMSKLPEDAVYRELFDAKKTVYNDSHEITINKIPIELYVQDSAEPAESLGLYSVLNRKWLKVPSKRRAHIDQSVVSDKHEKMVKLIDVALRSHNLTGITALLKTIHRYRQAGLNSGGEFSPENLVYKMIRTEGLLTKLYALRDKLHSKRLSIEGQYAVESAYPDNVFLKPSQISGSHTDKEMMQVGFRKTANGSWYILRSKLKGALAKLASPNKPSQYSESASGYIPSNAERDDPRFKTALTVDIKPDTLKKNAKKLGFKISRAGIPPLLRP